MCGDAGVFPLVDRECRILGVDAALFGDVEESNFDDRCRWGGAVLDDPVIVIGACLLYPG